MPTTTPTTIVDWQKHIDKLERQRADIPTKVSSLEQERAKLALAATLDDPEAQARLDAIRAMILAERMRSDELTDAIEAARDEIEKREAASSLAERRKRAKDVRSRVKGGRQIADEIDQTMARLGTLLIERHQNAIELTRAANLDSSARHRSVSKVYVLSALHHHGVHQHVPMDRVSAAHWRPFAESHGFVLDAAEAAAKKLEAGIEPNVADTDTDAE